MNASKPISKNFTVHNVQYCYAAECFGIENLANQSVIENAEVLANRVLEPLVEKFDTLNIHAWYRSEALEKQLRISHFHKWCVQNRKRFQDTDSWAQYLSEKQHTTGRAVDFSVPQDKTMACVAYIKKNLEFDVLRQEFGCIHVSFILGKNRALYENPR